jgi:hypothetical protein
MRRLRSTVLLTGLVLGMVSLASASAQAAAPEWFQKGAVLSHSVAFTSTGGKSVLRFDEIALECSAEKSSGTIEPPNKEKGVVIVLTGCSAMNGGETCSFHSKGAREGEIVTEPLAGRLGSVAHEQAASEVGLLLEEENESGKRQFARLEGRCLEVPLTLTGSVAGEVTPVLSEQASSKLTFARVGSKQAIRRIVVNGVVKNPAMLLGGIYETTYEGAASLTLVQALEVI